MKNTNTKRGMRSNFTLKLSSAEDEIRKTRKLQKHSTISRIIQYTHQSSPTIIMIRRNL